MRNLFMLQLALVVGLFTACYEGINESGAEDLIAHELINGGGEDLGMLEVIHDSVFKELYKKSAGKNIKTSETIDYTINGPEGGSASVVKSKVRNVENNFPYYDDSYIITYSGYRECGYVIEGSFSFYTGIRYESIPSPHTVDFIYAGGGQGGSLDITGRATMTVPVSIEILNMLDGIEYHFNEALVVTYGETKREMKMLAGLYRKTFRDAYNGLTMTGSNSDNISIDGPQGGSANLSTTRRSMGAYTIQTETFTFTDYSGNGLILNGTLTRSFMYNTTSGNIVEGCNETQYMEVTGLYETSVQHLLLIHKPFSIWNFRMGYFVNGFYYESVSILLNVGVGVGR